MPTVVLPPVTPFTCQVTAVLVDVVALLSWTEAEKSNGSLIPTDPEPGLTVTDVTVAVPLPPPQAACARIPAKAAARVNKFRFESRFRVMF